MKIRATKLTAIASAIQKLLGTFTPQSLFTSGVNGAWYDPSDINLTWRRNLLTYKEQFDNAAWAKISATVTANAVVAPDGTTTADKFIPSAGAAGATCSQAISVATTQYTFTFRAKAAEQSAISLVSNLTGAFRANVFNLSAQTVLPGTGWTASITPDPEGNEWFICSCSAMADTAASKSFQISNNSAGWKGDGTSGIYIWGAQLELGSTATPYQRITDGIKDYLDYKPLPILYQDAAGTTPVTAVGQPVGLMLDKSKGLALGGEILTNGTFDSSIAGWTAGAGSAAWVAGTAQITGAAGVIARLYQGMTLTAGKWYRMTATCVSTTDVSATLEFLGGGVSTTFTAGQTKSLYFYPTSTGTFYAQVRNSNAGTWVSAFDNISVRELPGNHAFNPSGNSANFPVLSARYNLLTKTEQFDDAAWSKTRCSISLNAVIAPDGTLTADKLVEDTSASTTHPVQSGTIVFSAISYTGSVYLKKGERAWALVRVGASGASLSAYFDLANGVEGTLGVAVTSATITPVGNDWYKCSVTGTATAVTDFGLSVFPATGNNGVSYTGDGASGIYIWGADLRVANDALNQPAYQRVNTSTDYDTVGFKPYLSFNGVNQWLQTNSIDFTYGNKMFVSAGVRKLSDPPPQ